IVPIALTGNIAPYRNAKTTVAMIPLLPDGEQDFLGYTSSGTTAVSGHGFFTVGNSFGLTQSTDEFGAYVMGGMADQALTDEETGYFEVKASGGLARFKLTGITAGEFTATDDPPVQVVESAFKNIYVEGYLNGVLQGTSNVIHSIADYELEYGGLVLGDLTGKHIDSYRFYFTGSPGAYLNVINILSFTVADAIGIDQVASAPTVTTSAASMVTLNSATLGGAVTDDGGAEITFRGIEYSTTEGFTEGTGTQVAAGEGDHACR